MAFLPDRLGNQSNRKCSEGNSVYTYISNRTRDRVHMDYPGHCDPFLFEPKGIMPIVYSAHSLGRDPRTRPANIFSGVWYQCGIKALARSSLRVWEIYFMRGWVCSISAQTLFP